ncbi:family A1 protease [Mycena haematopus]|nr:family A1 protease [Mycena haematopus]
MVQLTFTLLPAIFAVRVVAGPVLVKDSIVTLPISRFFNFTGTRTIVQKDIARAQAFNSRKAAKNDARQVISEPVNNMVVSYIASIGVGSPATTYKLLIDTGSSNTWLGAGQKYVRTSTSMETVRQTRKWQSVEYGSGSFSGTEYTDQVTLASGLVIAKQSIGVAYESTGFTGCTFVLIGPVDLTKGTLTPGRSTLIPTVTDKLVSQGTIPASMMGIYFQPKGESSTLTVPITSPDGADNANGSIAFGGTDPTRFTKSISYTPITSTAPASDFWGIDQTVTYGSTTILSLTAGIVDTGTTLILLATDAFQNYKHETGAVEDRRTGLLRVTPAQFSRIQNLNFVIGDSTYSLTPNAQIWPRSLNSDIGGDADSIYLIVSDLGTPSGEGLDFINGYKFLERFYSAYDADNARIGFATTSFTTATTN